MAMGTAAALRVHAAAGAQELLTLETRARSLRACSDPEALEAFCAETARLPIGANRSAVFSAHQMGTCRMGVDRRTAVCDPSGEVFGVRGLYVADASAFPASSGVNPMITVMALAHHVARQIPQAG